MNSRPFHIEVDIRWAEVDQNGHTRNSAYLDLASHSRICFFDSHGFSAKAFARKRIGPVVFKDEMEYRKETFLGDHLQVSLLLAGLSPQGFRFALRNEFRRADGTLAVVIRTYAGWLDLTGRRLVNPPTDLFEVMSKLQRTKEFQVLRDKSSSGQSS